MKSILLATLSVILFLTNSAIAKNLANAGTVNKETANSEQVITIHKLNAAPSMDGFFKGWADTDFNEIPLIYTTDKSKKFSAKLQAGVFEDEVYFYAEWADDTHDVIHKPYVWDTEKNKYKSGDEREDRFAMQFEISGDYTTNWFSGSEFKADMWHWKSSRSNPLGITHDKHTTLTKTPIRGSYKHKLKDGAFIYLSRKSDDGKPYKTKRYFKKQKDKMPKYLLSQDRPEEMEQIKAKGVWSDGKWHLLQKRKLNTKDKNDVVFAAGSSVKGGIAIFNRDDNQNHFTSKTLSFKFSP